MRKINYIVVHCTAGPQDQTQEAIEAYWKKLGWRSKGYHYLVNAKGHVALLTVEDNVANGVKGHNHHAIHIAYTGGVKDGKAVDNRTPEQKEALRWLIDRTARFYPGAKIVGHRDLSPDADGDGTVEAHEWLKACPCFDAKAEYSYLER